MQDVTTILQRLENGDGHAREELLPLVYDQLRRIAAKQLGDERTDHTLTATALVHEAYLRLVGSKPEEDVYQSRAHFFAVAARAMRQVLVDSARRKKSQKRGGNQVVVRLEENLVSGGEGDPDIEALDQALTVLEQEHPDLYELVSLRYFAGMTMPQAAQVQGISLRTAERNWHFARAWLRAELSDG